MPAPLPRATRKKECDAVPDVARPLFEVVYVVEPGRAWRAGIRHVSQPEREGAITMGGHGGPRRRTGIQGSEATLPGARD
jgi:hypothetical protein